MGGESFVSEWEVRAARAVAKTAREIVILAGIGAVVCAVVLARATGFDLGHLSDLAAGAFGGVFGCVFGVWLIAVLGLTEITHRLTACIDEEDHAAAHRNAT